MANINCTKETYHFGIAHNCKQNQKWSIECPFVCMTKKGEKNDTN